MPNINELITKNKKLKEYINLFKININTIINMLNDVKKKMDIYYKINEDIINNYDNKKRNYEIIYNLNQLQLQSKNVIGELNNAIKCDTITEKLNKMFNIYKKMNIDEINIIYKLKDKNCQLFGKEFVERYKNICNPF